MFARIEQVTGLILIAVTLADVFLNVLYARAGIAILSRPIAHAVRNLFVGLGRLINILAFSFGGALIAFGLSRIEWLSFPLMFVVVALMYAEFHWAATMAFWSDSGSTLVRTFNTIPYAALCSFDT